MDDNKSKALAAALSQIEKQFGKGSIMRLGEHQVAKDLQVVSTGSVWISRWGWAACRVVAWLKSTARNLPARLR